MNVQKENENKKRIYSWEKNKYFIIPVVLILAIIILLLSFNLLPFQFNIKKAYANEQYEKIVQKYKRIKSPDDIEKLYIGDSFRQLDYDLSKDQEAYNFFKKNFASLNPELLINDLQGDLYLYFLKGGLKRGNFDHIFSFLILDPDQVVDREYIQECKKSLCYELAAQGASKVTNAFIDSNYILKFAKNCLDLDDIEFEGEDVEQVAHVLSSLAANVSVFGKEKLSDLYVAVEETGTNLNSWANSERYFTDILDESIDYFETEDEANKYLTPDKMEEVVTTMHEKPYLPDTNPTPLEGARNSLKDAFDKVYYGEGIYNFTQPMIDSASQLAQDLKADDLEFKKRRAEKMQELEDRRQAIKEEEKDNDKYKETFSLIDDMGTGQKLPIDILLASCTYPVVDRMGNNSKDEYGLVFTWNEGGFYNISITATLGGASNYVDISSQGVYKAQEGILYMVWPKELISRDIEGTLRSIKGSTYNFPSVIVPFKVNTQEGSKLIRIMGDGSLSDRWRFK
ncbi:MAG: hypothetical protein Q4P25_02680 [Tissierellia bacterium]|nr:hypothetical protein [Tissierellia bacterium]